MTLSSQSFTICSLEILRVCSQIQHKEVNHLAAGNDKFQNNYILRLPIKHRYETAVVRWVFAHTDKHAAKTLITKAIISRII